MLLTHLSRWEAVYIYKCVCKWVQVDINTQLSLSTFLQGTGRYHGISTKMHLKVEKDTSHYCPSTLIAYAFPCLVREQRSLKNVQLSTSFLFSGMIYVKISSRSIDLFAVSYGSLKWVSINSQPTHIDSWTLICFYNEWWVTLTLFSSLCTCLGRDTLVNTREAVQATGCHRGFVLRLDPTKHWDIELRLGLCAKGFLPRRTGKTRLIHRYIF